MAPVLDEIRRWILHSGVGASSPALLEPDLPRWERRLRAKGITIVTPPTFRGPHDRRADDWLSLWVMQRMAVRDAAREHALRNHTGTRQYKP
jgi:hypothetical protein